jgi:hypothetical protein
MGKLSTTGEPAELWLPGPAGVDKPPNEGGLAGSFCIHYTSRHATMSPEGNSIRDRLAIFVARHLARAWSRTGNRRGRRRSERQRNLFASRCPVRIFAVVDRVPDAAVHDGDPDYQCRYRLEYLTRTCTQYRAGASALGTLSARGVAVGCQYHQHCRGSCGHGRGVAISRWRLGTGLCRSIRDRMSRCRGADPYHRYAGILKMLTLVLLFYVAAAFSVHVAWGEVAQADWSRNSA